jgi:hypothetical protein
MTKNLATTRKVSHVCNISIKAESTWHACRREQQLLLSQHGMFDDESAIIIAESSCRVIGTNVHQLARDGNMATLLIAHHMSVHVRAKRQQHASTLVTSHAHVPNPSQTHPRLIPDSSQRSGLIQDSFQEPKLSPNSPKHIPRIQSKSKRRSKFGLKSRRVRGRSQRCHR